MMNRILFLGGLLSLASAPLARAGGLQIKGTQLADSWGLIPGDQIVEILGQSPPKDEAQLSARLKALQQGGKTPRITIRRKGKQATVVRCIAIPSEFKRLRELTTALQTPLQDPRRETLRRDFERHVREVLPQAFDQVNQWYVDELAETHGRRCIDQTFEACTAEGRVCPVKDELPFFRLSIQAGDGSQSIASDGEALYRFYTKIKDEKRAAFLRTVAETTEYGWPRYIEQLTDDQGVPTYGSGNMARACFLWSRYHQKYPDAHPEEVQRNRDDACEKLLRPSCIYETGIEPVLREAQAYLDLDASSSVAAGVKALLADFPQRMRDWTLGCRPGGEGYSPVIVKRVCDASQNGAKPGPLRWVGTYVHEGNGPEHRILNLFERHGRCEADIVYGEQAFTKVFLPSVSCTLPSGRLAFSFQDPGGLGIPGFSRADQTLLSFAGTLAKDGSIRGEFVDPQRAARKPTRWQPKPGMDGIARRIALALHEELRELACVRSAAEVGDPVEVQARIVEEQPVGLETGDRSFSLLCPEKLESSYLFPLLEQAAQDPKRLERLRALLDAVRFGPVYGPAWAACFGRLLTQPGLAKVPKASFELGMAAVAKGWEYSWNHSNIIQPFVTALRAEPAVKRCLTPGERPLQTCRRIHDGVQIVLRAWESRRDAMLPGYADRKRAESEASILNPVVDLLRELDGALGSRQP